MKNRGLFYATFVLIVLFAINIVSAEIMISQPASLYNVGDDFSLFVSLKPSIDTNGFLAAKIVCSNGEVEIFKSAYNVKSSDGMNVTISAKIDSSLVNELRGVCFLNAKFGSEEANSQNFELSDKINVNLIVTNSIISPGEKIILSGTAKKSNGINVNGFVGASISGLNLSVTSIVKDGNFNFDITIPENSASGSYELISYVYEKDSSGKVANQGSTSTAIKVKQVPKRIDVAIEGPELMPPANLSSTVLLYDQAGSEINIDIPITVYDSKGSVFLKKIVHSSTINSIQLPYNANPGYWTIEAVYEDISAKRSFYLEEVQKASFSIENQTLVIKNIGNVPYNKNVEVIIGNENEIKKVNIPVGEEKRFKLFAPAGSYEISVNEGSNAESVGSSFLTGNAVGVKDINSLTSDPNIMMWFWIFIIIILLAIGLWYYRKVRSRTYTASTPIFSKFKEKPKFVPISGSSFPEKSSEREVRNKKVETYNPDSKTAQGYISQSGSKEPVVVVALKIKNSRKLRESESSAFLTIEHSLQKVRNAKAKVYDQGDFSIIVFSPKMTQKTELDNYQEAIKLAFQIDSDLKEFNKKYAIKIDYGLGAHVGEMFLEIVEGRPKFTSTGNVTILAKNAAEKANNELFTSSLLHRKVYNIVKGEQTQYGLFKVNSILNRGQHSAFIQKFMKKKEEK